MYANSDLAKIKKWAKENKTHFKETKSMAILLTKKSNNNNINIYLNKKRLEVVTKIKYFGMYFDCRLAFDNNIKYIAENYTRMIHMLSRPANPH